MRQFPSSEFSQINHPLNGAEFISDLWEDIISRYFLEIPSGKQNENFRPQVVLSQKIRIIISNKLFKEFKQYLEVLPAFVIEKISPNTFHIIDSGVQVSFLEPSGQSILRLELSHSYQGLFQEVTREDCLSFPEKALGNAFRRYCTLGSLQVSSEVQKKVATTIGLQAYMHSEEFPSSPRRYSPEAWAFLQNFPLENFKYRAWFGNYIGFFSPVLQDRNLTVIGLVKVNGVYTTRLFYFSKSGGNWHGCPGIEGNLYSKGMLPEWSMSYENGTVVQESLRNFFDLLPKESALGKNGNAFDFENNPEILRNYWKQAHGNLSEFEIQQDLLRDYANEALYITHLLPDSASFAHIYGKDGNKYEISDSHLQYEMANIPVQDELVNNLAYAGIKNSSTHPILGAVVATYVFRSQLFGRSVLVQYSVASDASQNGWIDGITYEHSASTSWGFNKEQINAGILCTKPIEYIDQCPKYMQVGAMSVGKNYLDIRPYIQTNPLIRKIKILGNF